MSGKKKKRRRSAEVVAKTPAPEPVVEAGRAPSEASNAIAVPFLDRNRVAILAGLVALIVYLPRIHRTLSLQGDSAVFVSSSAMFGVPQPSGYPLYTLLGFLFTKLPFGEVAFRVHLFSAFCHAAAVSIVALTIFELTRSRLAAFSGALCLAFARAFFQGSLYAEVFPFNDLFTALILFLAIEFCASEDDAVRERRLPRLAVAIGFASAHHQMIALTAPALVVLLLMGGVLRVLDGPRLARLFGLFLAPMLVFYLTTTVAASRDPLSSWGDVHDLKSLFALATRQDYGGILSPHLERPTIDRWDIVESQLLGVARHFGWLSVALAAAGAYFLYKRKSFAPLAALTMAFVAAGPFFAAVNRIDPSTEHGLAYSDRFATMSLVPIGIVVGCGIAFAIEQLPLMFPEPLVRALFGLSFVVPLAMHASDVDQRDNRMGIALARDLLADAPDRSLVLLSGDHANGIALYLCGVEKRCGSRIVMSPGQMHLEWRVRQLKRRYPDLVIPPATGHVPRDGKMIDIVTTRDLVAANLPLRPIVISADILDREPALREAFQFIPDGLLVRVLPDEPSIEREKPRFLARAKELGSGVRCEGCGASADKLHHPSLETAIPYAYALTFENHARILRAWFPTETVLASTLEERALAADSKLIRGLRGMPPP